ncbi:MAG: DUF1963 domain-containing protein [Coriobacteriales bacterium]|jgi:uncharacterized protein YwqG|nr:DUF1963 domain-containing protein [Coriobacteriales bacterium]
MKNSLIVRTVVILLLMIGATVAILIIEDPGYLHTWQYVSLIIAGIGALAAQAIIPRTRQQKSEYSTNRGMGQAGVQTQATEGLTRQSEAGPLEVELSESDQEAIGEVLARTNRPYIELKALRKQTDVFDSKFGGQPYLPPGFDYPHNLNDYSDKKPLKLLCQLNLANLPHLPGFPQRGMLQFYLPYEANEDVYGADFEHPTKQAGWRIAYHREIIEDRSRLQAPPALAENGMFPFEGEFALEAKQAVMPITPGDWEWEEFVKNSFESSSIGAHLKDKMHEDAVEMVLCGLANEPGHRMGGYPNFTQYDPREEGEFPDHSILLLQIDTDSEITWGDAGVANFFIAPEALKHCDFSDVLFHWDCF